MVEKNRSSGPAGASAEDADPPPPRGLTRNQRLVYDALIDGGEPAKAYDLLGRLAAQGVRAPMTVYRALDGLEARGLVHKLDVVGAYVPCRRGAPHAVETFLVCRVCAGIEEVARTDEHAARTRFHTIAADRDFAAERGRLEIRGVCGGCAQAGALP